MYRFVLFLGLVGVCLFPSFSYADVRLYKLTPEEVISTIQAREGRKVFFVYTSWCSSCRKILPELVKLEKTYDGSVIAVSIDKDSKQLAAYIGKYNSLPFPALIVEEQYKGHLSQVLRRTGINLPNLIPYVALIDEKGAVFAQGTMGLKDVVRFIEGGAS